MLSLSTVPPHHAYQRQVLKLALMCYCTREGLPGTYLAFIVVSDYLPIIYSCQRFSGSAAASVLRNTYDIL